MTITQKDVAQKARVSISTVCLVLRDDPRISDHTRKTVLEAASELGYLARTSLHTPTDAHHIGVLLANPGVHPTADHFFGEVMHGVTEEAERFGHTVSVSSFDGQTLPRLAREKRVHGFIIGGTPITPGLIEQVRALTLPSVFIGRYHNHLHLNAVLTDNPSGAALATSHLLKQGHQQILFISGDPTEAVVSLDRLDGYLRACREAGVPSGPIRHAPRTIEGGMQAVQQALDEGLKFDAVFAAEDLMALGVLRLLKQRNIRVPEDIPVVGYSDIHMAALSDPPLTTVHVPRRRLGRTAARLLDDLLTGRAEPNLHVTIPPRLVVRQSCGGEPEP
ncbi:LacI family DNA-binding transcriptional regulator [Deinococcus roseus]|uniref:LacI family transcriptional regulator n=1 Tax=Deinococcus roseus TaxID=392414 RepID=A0ABQ2DJS8_9DEIO|nr:LacI family DNA-binding transcriptional regulator [Deinococcus roseus]GGJ57187.1 LacI family transcriptional regulator [Deinococcus roseus]